MIVYDRKTSFDDMCSIIEEFAPCMNDYLFVYDFSLDTFYITKRALDRFALPSNRIQNPYKNSSAFIYPDDIGEFSADMKQLVSDRQVFHNLTYRWLGKNGKPVWINCRALLIETESRKHGLLMGCINEIGRKATADNVSGLLGADSMLEHLRRLMPGLSAVTLMRIGIDDFKIINERHGRSYGDIVQGDVAECIRSSLAPGQFVYHIADDEFMVLDLSGADPDAMNRLYHTICSKVNTAIIRQDYKAIYTLSAGLLPLNDPLKNGDEDFSEAMMLSEFSLSEAVNRGKNQLYVFREKDYEDFLRKRRIRSLLRQSISENCSGFETYYQSLVRPQTGVLYAAEVLLRFHAPSGELISPADFVPILEESGLIIPVGRWLLAQALDMCKRVRTTYPDFMVSVNLSYIQLSRSQVYEDIMSALQEANLPPSCLIVELTESGQLENSPAVRDIWDRLKQEGVTIALDDFGTGYSNLIDIGTLRPNIVKMDHVFTGNALKNDFDFDLLTYIIHMVHAVGSQLVIEGVETLEDMIRILRLEPDFIQGYFYCVPCCASDFLHKYHI